MNSLMQHMWQIQEDPFHLLITHSEGSQLMSHSLRYVLRCLYWYKGKHKKISAALWFDLSGQFETMKWKRPHLEGYFHFYIEHFSKGSSFHPNTSWTPLERPKEKGERPTGRRKGSDECMGRCLGGYRPCDREKGG